MPKSETQQPLPTLYQTLQHRPQQASPRYSFMYEWCYMAMDLAIKEQRPHVLNVGCADDPADFEGTAMHFDIDDWSKVHQFFQQGDAHDLKYPDRSWHTVVLGDIIEHVIDPLQVMKEACRVAQKYVVMTIFEEWRIGEGIGPHIEGGQAASDIDSQKLGHKDRTAAQKAYNKEVVLVPDTVENPHWSHIWQFTTSYIVNLITQAARPEFTIRYFQKEWEALHKPTGHNIHNWLVCLERKEE